MLVCAGVVRDPRGTPLRSGPGLCWCNLLFALVLEYCSDALLHGYLTILDCDIIFDIVSRIRTYYLWHFSPALILGATGTC